MTVENSHLETTLTDEARHWEGRELIKPLTLRELLAELERFDKAHAGERIYVVLGNNYSFATKESGGLKKLKFKNKKRKAVLRVIDEDQFLGRTHPNIKQAIEFFTPENFEHLDYPMHTDFHSLEEYCIYKLLMVENLLVLCIDEEYYGK